VLLSDSAVRGCWEFNHIPLATGILGILGPLEAVLADSFGDVEIEGHFRIFQRTKNDDSSHDFVMLKKVSTESMESALSEVEDFIEGREDIVIIHIVSNSDYNACESDMKQMIAQEANAESIQETLTDTLTDTIAKERAEFVLHVEGIQYLREMGARNVAMLETYVIDDAGNTKPVCGLSTAVLDTIFAQTLSQISSYSKRPRVVDPLTQAVSTWYNKWVVEHGDKTREFS